jgi:hypothetical protein
MELWERDRTWAYALMNFAASTSLTPTILTVSMGCIAWDILQHKFLVLRFVRQLSESGTVGLFHRHLRLCDLDEQGAQ